MVSESLASRQRDLDKILDEASALQKANEGKKWEPKDRERFETLCREGDEIQKDIEAEQSLKRLEEGRNRMREVPDPSLPSNRNPVRSQPVLGAKDIAGYVSLGDAILASEAFAKFHRDGYATGTRAVVQIAAAIHGKNLMHGPHREPLIPLNRDQRKMFETWLESKEAKAVPTLGAGILDPERVARIPQVTADERLRIRDVIAQGTTGASAVEYVREDSTSGEPAETAHGDLKPEIGIVYSLQSAPVRTIAGWIPVQNQQLEDWPQLRSLIDTRLRYKVQRREEQQIFYGDGTPPNIEGILEVSGTIDIATNGRTTGSDTLIDIVRRGITDVFVAGYEPNAVAIHPYDWETILLEKGSDNRYVWAVVTDNNGSRIWGVRVVESVGLASRATGPTIPRRELVVGDFQMGAQLLDRMDLTVQVGLVDDQFIRNMRTILAEERLALAIYAPKAFAHYQTQEES